jgi:hypothetical protein
MRAGREGGKDESRQAGREGGKVWMGGMLVGRQVRLHVTLWRGRCESGGGVP